jgi:DNA invertase Pin-like site-specific DNA recombinase
MTRLPNQERAATYARFSSNNSKDTSIDDQQAMCRRRTEEMGYDLDPGHEFADRALHGEAVKHREGILRLVEGVKAKKFDVLIVEEMDRLSRNLADLAWFYNLCVFHRVRIETPSGAVADTMTVAFRGLQAQQFNRDLATKVRRGQVGAVGRGKAVCGVAYGYKIIWVGQPPETVRIIDPERAAIVQRIYEEYAAGMGSTGIVARLNAEGIPGPGGKAWQPAALLGNVKWGTGILRSPIYVGKIRYGLKAGRMNPETGVRSYELGDPAQIVFGAAEHMRIISDALYNEVQTKLAENSRKRSFLCREPKFLLSGKLKCAECGNSYVVIDRRNMGCSGFTLRKSCQNNRRIDGDEVEAKFLEHLRGPLAQDGLVTIFIDRYTAAARKWRLERASKTVGDQARLKDLDRRYDGLFEELDGPELAPEVKKDIRIRLNALSEQRAQIRDLLATDLTCPTALPTAAEVAARLRVGLKELCQELRREGVAAAKARMTVGNLVDKIVVTPLPNPKPGSQGCRLAELEVTGPIVNLLGIANSPSSVMIMLDGESLAQHYYEEASFSFRLVVGGNAMMAHKPPVSLPSVTLAMALHEFPMRRKDLALVLQQEEPALSHDAATARVGWALKWLDRRGRLQVTQAVGERGPHGRRFQMVDGSPAADLDCD